MVKVGKEIKAFEYEREYYKVLGRLKNVKLSTLYRTGLELGQ
jgi:hypothetical protein